MEPTIGRTVHYQSYGTPAGEYLPEPRAAIITEVHTDGVVGLCVVNPTGQFFHRSVPFSESPKSGHWNWPPIVND
ncbi:hypothetical protein SEA_ODESZA_1 [Gordonia Phage Odesza]|uniref:Uncharacterized protein n=5 Tax=Tanisvirus tanis TaxID=2844677 RepID=A0A7D5K6B7_9CAUD|nr:hypothetical protein HWC73_gp01 [Gordonia phage Tanis]AVO25242.1 hypothetical protein PBI_GRAVY_1 [Gordonia phage Gravy]AVO25335.1 hypothetical protein PBI_KERRY_1 [Gordonia phage Kerry]QGJ89613.1 hypothetical protein SEA_ODESZA_1 [Gordonia Phage Odesza]QKY78673.1 hypothetical protein SEA_GILL_1 [Gordonia phage Gill]QLF83717.1 hypothetical protein SEA_MAGEL_1 [Gordonia phage Magel]QYW00640.1 hypothetical protein SEA_RONEY_1 [Gordonia phage Roney]